MVHEAIDKIRETEQNAVKLIEDAKKNRLEIISSAREEGEKMLADILRSEQEEINKVVSEAENAAKEEAKKLSEKLAGELKESIVKWKSNTDKAVSKMMNILIGE